jgi:hypothetical protein
MERIEVSKISNKVTHSKEKGIISRVIERCNEDRQCTRTPNRVDVFGTGITFHIVDTVHLRHIKLRYKPTDAH